MFSIVFIAGIARGFAEPAAGALEAQVVPWEMLIHSSATMASCWLTAAVVGPLLGGASFAVIGAPGTYVGIAILYTAARYAITGIGPKPIPVAPKGETIWQSVAVGVRYVVRDQVLVGSMALDLFAVLFGGAIALLPLFAKEILDVGPIGLGVLNAAPTSGALLTMLYATRYPPVNHAGRTLLWAVAGFGISMIVFALSENIYLSLFALFMSGVCDGVSVVIRRSIIRIMSPEHLRGRIAAVSMIFIGSSNEIGALESGVAAAALGAVRSVWMGAIITLGVVGSVAAFAPKLRRLHLDPSQVSRLNKRVDAELDSDEVEALREVRE
jgi:MFS family permease